MKKEYVAPKAEKMEFQYSETVVASSVGCGGAYQLYNETYGGCNETPTGKWSHEFTSENGSDWS